MPQYFAPGVYVEEVSSGTKPIAGVGTSTAGFVGVVADDVRMPARPGQFQVDKDGKAVLDAQGNPQPILYPIAPALQPILITGWDGFRTNFGDLQAGNKTLAHAVYGFFNNGGTRCWISRVAPGAATQTTQRAGGRTNRAAAAPETTDQPPAPAPSGPSAAPPSAPASLIVGLADARTALDGFAAIDEIALVAIPGAVDVAVQNALLEHCGSPFLGDRFAILDGVQTPESLTKDDIAGGVTSSSYGALYFPWIDVYDPDTNATIAVPPSGHIAGVYARVDAERGVHKAPANEVIRGAVDVDRLVSKEDQAGLNPAGVNVIRKFGGDITIWGARTLSNDPEWRYVNVRRLFLFLRESIDEGTQWVVFEPNDAALWAKIRRNITAFLTNIWRGGALFGATPQEAFFVRCDETTNPPDVRDLGQVVTEIGVAVTRPAEFVIFRVSQWSGPNT